MTYDFFDPSTYPVQIKKFFLNFEAEMFLIMFGVDPLSDYNQAHLILKPFKCTYLF